MKNFNPILVQFCSTALEFVDIGEHTITPKEIYFDGPKSWCTDEFPEAEATSICLKVDLNDKIVASIYAPCVWCDEIDAYLDTEWHKFDISKEDADYLIDLAKSKSKS